MASEQRFLIVKSKDSKEIKYFDYDHLDGYNLTPKKNVRFEDAISINRMIIINPTLIEKMVDKKIKRKFDQFISMISVVCEDNDPTGTGYMLALTEADKFRMELINKYKKYIKEEKLELILKKISILEDELRLRLQVLELPYQESYDNEKQGKSR